jgi:hypothetical protein
MSEPKEGPSATSAQPTDGIQTTESGLSADATRYFALNHSWVYFGWKCPVRFTEVGGKFVAFKIEKGEATEVVKFKSERHWPADEIAKLWVRQHPNEPPPNRLGAISEALFSPRARDRWQSFGTVLITPQAREKWREKGDEVLRFPFNGRESPDEFRNWMLEQTPSLDAAGDSRYQDGTP